MQIAPIHTKKGYTLTFFLLLYLTSISYNTEPMCLALVGFKLWY